MKKRTLCLLLLLVTGCGGGGGGGTTPPPGETGSASGAVKQRANGAPVAGATVTIGSRQGATNAQGQYRISAIPVGTTQLRVEAGGFATMTGTLPAAIAAGENAVPDVLLQPSLSDTAPGGPYSVQGRVTLSGGSSATGASVVALDPGTGVPVDQAQAGGDGRYTLWVPAGSYRLRASHPGFTAQEREIAVVDVNQPVTADFVLAP